jgi:TonB family protein
MSLKRWAAGAILGAFILATPAPVPAQEAPAAEEPRAAGTEVPVPKRSKFVQPEYPAEALARGLRGIVILALTIDPTGKVAKVDVVRSLPPFDEAASSAALQWEYEVTKVDGKPVPVRLTVPITFALKLPEMSREPGIPELRQGVTPPFPPNPPTTTGPRTVTADVTIDPAGQLVEAEIKHGEPPWSESLLMALRTWRFTPSGSDRMISFQVRADFSSGGGPPKVDLKLSGLRQGEVPAAAAPAPTEPPAAPASAPAAPADTAPTTGAGAARTDPPATPPEATAPATSPPAPSAPAPTNEAAAPPPAAPAPAPATATPPETSPAPTARPETPPPTRPEAAPPAAPTATTPPSTPTARPPTGEAAAAPAPGTPSAGAPPKDPPAASGASSPPPVEIIPPAPAPPPRVEPGVSAVQDVLLGPGVPDLSKGRRPVAPPVARMNSISGNVEVRFVVEASGASSVRDVEGPELLKEAARQTVASWMFRRTTPERLPLVAIFSYIGDGASASVKIAE